MEKRLKVIIEDLTNHPYCEHGPTLLFNKLSQGKEERYFACSACRDRNLCSFYMKYEKLKDVHLSFKKLESDKKNSSRTLKEVKLLGLYNLNLLNLILIIGYSDSTERSLLL